MQPDFSEIEERVIRSVRGTVLEIGAGDGANFDDLPKDITWIGLEPDDGVLATLRNRSLRFSRSSTVIEGVAESLPLEDSSVDSVLGTFVLCSVDDPGRVLAEIKRVLKPGGHFAFVEHVAAERGTMTRVLQRLFAPSRRRPGQCDPVRDTLATIQAEFESVDADKYRVRGIQTLGVGIPHVAGLARTALA